MKRVIKKSKLGDWLDDLPNFVGWKIVALTSMYQGRRKKQEQVAGARVDSARILRLAKLSLCLVLSFNIWCGVAGTVIETAPSPASRKHECIIFWGDPLTHSLFSHSLTHSSFTHTRHSGSFTRLVVIVTC